MFSYSMNEFHKFFVWTFFFQTKGDCVELESWIWEYFSAFHSFTAINYAFDESCSKVMKSLDWKGEAIITLMMMMIMMLRSHLKMRENIYFTNWFDLCLLLPRIAIYLHLLLTFCLFFCFSLFFFFAWFSTVIANVYNVLITTAIAIASTTTTTPPCRLAFYFYLIIYLL